MQATSESEKIMIKIRRFGVFHITYLSLLKKLQPIKGNGSFKQHASSVKHHASNDRKFKRVFIPNENKSVADPDPSYFYKFSEKNL